MGSMWWARGWGARQGARSAFTLTDERSPRTRRFRGPNGAPTMHDDVQHAVRQYQEWYFWIHYLGTKWVYSYGGWNN